MTNPTRRHLPGPALALLCLAFCCLESAHGQEEQEPPWFRVELMIFSQPDPAAAFSEQWQATPFLHYPERYRFLVEPDLVEANLAGLRATSAVDEFGLQTITLLPEPDPEELPDDKAGADLEPEPADELPEDREPEPAGGFAEDALLQEPDAAEQPPPRPTPFVVLADKELEFRGKAAYMERRGGYRILFHRGWLQPGEPRESARPLILDRSGDNGRWPPLQGSVLLYLSRYLHLETDLWLNTSGDYLPGEWRMPAPPLGPASVVTIELPEPEPDPADADLTPWGPVPGEDASAEPVPVEPAEPVYSWRHAVVLQQKRRMRSGEIHYLDHPLLGLVIKLTPVPAEELTARALAEQCAREDQDGAAPAPQSGSAAACDQAL